MPTMEITTRIGCKNACVYCPQEKLVSAYAKRRGEAMMSFETFKVCIDKIPAEVDIEFSGMAEPWLNSECTKMVFYANEKGHRINVYTTLVGMSEADVEALEKIPFKRFWVHLPSRNGEEKISIDASFLKVLERIHKFLDAKKDSIEVSFHFRGVDAHPKIKELLGDSIKRKSLSTRANNVVVKDIAEPKRKRGVIGCQRGLRNNVLLPNGDVLLCCMDYGMQHVLGNLLFDSYELLFSGEEFKKIVASLMDESLDTLCRYCDMFAYEKNASVEAMNFIKKAGRKITNIWRKKKKK